MQTSEFEKIAVKTSVITIIVNAILSVFKLLAGIFGASMALISDAVHSASDVFSTIIVLLGVKISSKQADKKHPFGHERFECVAAIILAVVLFATGVGIGYSGVENIVTGAYNSFEKPQVIALVAAAVSIVVKELMFWYTIVAAKKINSSALKAMAPPLGRAVFRGQSCRCCRRNVRRACSRFGCLSCYLCYDFNCCRSYFYRCR